MSEEREGVQRQRNMRTLCEACANLVRNLVRKCVLPTLCDDVFANLVRGGGSGRTSFAQGRRLKANSNMLKDLKFEMLSAGLLLFVTP